MNILYINDELATADGSNYHANGILQGLQKVLGEGHVRSYPQPVDGSMTQIKHLPSSGLRGNKNVMQMIRLVRKNYLSHVRKREIVKMLDEEKWVPDYVLARTIMFDSTALYIAQHYQAKLILEANAPMYYEHCVLGKLPLMGMVEGWEKKLLQSADKVYTVSSVCRDMLCRHYRMDADKFVVIPNGYQENLFQEDDREKLEIRSRVRIQEHWENRFVVTFIGSLKPWHGIDLLCQAAEALQDCQGIHFLVIGDGERYAQVQDYCSNHNNMTYKGKLDLEHMKQYLFASDLGIMPYQDMDAFYFSPLKMFDMIGAGLPFVGTAQGQIREICEELLTPEFLLEEDSAELFAERLKCLASSPEILVKMGGKIAGMRTKCTWLARTEELIKVLDID